jgi:hypothetical protein
VDVVNQAAKNGVSTARFKITQGQAAEIKVFEREQGHDAALCRILELLRARSRP